MTGAGVFEKIIRRDEQWSATIQPAQRWFRPQDTGTETAFIFCMVISAVLPVDHRMQMRASGMLRIVIPAMGLLDLCGHHAAGTFRCDQPAGESGTAQMKTQSRDKKGILLPVEEAGCLL